MSVMTHEHESHFIPSPFPAVTEYENAFIKAWRDNTANAVAELLKYVASATATAIKDDEIDVDIQKAEILLENEDAKVNNSKTYEDKVRQEVEYYKEQQRQAEAEPEGELKKILLVAANQGLAIAEAKLNTITKE